MTASRWTQTADGVLYTYVDGVSFEIAADQLSGTVEVAGIDGTALSPDQARAIGVRLIEAAALADGPRAVRRYRPEPEMPTYSCHSTSTQDGQ